MVDRPTPPSSSRSLSSFAQVTQLDLTDLPLYGRSKEIKQLQEIYDKASNRDDPDASSLQAVFVCGGSGTGKSTLVTKFCQKLLVTSSSLHKNNPRRAAHKSTPTAVSGKYDQFGVGKPYSALASALNDLCDELVALDDSSMVVRDKVTQAVGSEARVLMDVIPRLVQVVGPPVSGADDNDDSVDASASENKEAAFHRLAYVFRAFIRSVSCQLSGPLILFLDDLQWADASSLKLIQAMLLDKKAKNLLFIGTYRDNQVKQEHILTKMLEEIQEQKAIHQIQIENFSVDTVNEMLSDLTRLDLSTTSELADLVYQRTDGNMFFVLQLLDYLLKEDLLLYSLVTLKWTWDIHHIRENTKISDNVVELVTKKIQRLDEPVQFVLKIAACLWSTFDVNFLEPVLHQLSSDGSKNVLYDKERIQELLQVAVQEGLVEKISDSRYRFSHDRVQQGAYSLIPEGRDRDLMHLRIGDIIVTSAKNYKGSQEWMMFIAAHQLNRGSSRITDPAKQVALAELNLAVANMAISLSAFIPASEYLQSGIDILSQHEDNPWEHHYSLILPLYVTSAQMYLLSGKVEQCKAAVETVLSHAKSQRDKLPVYFCLLNLLQAVERKFDEAMEFGFKILLQLGERFPKNASTFYVVRDLVKTKRMLRKLGSDDALAKLPIMENEDKIAAMNVLNCLVISAFWSGKSAFFALLIMRMMELTLHYGVTKFSSYGFGNYAVLLCSLGDFKEAHRLGKFALQVVERLNAKECKGRVLILVYSFVNPWQDPLHDTLEPLLQSHTAGMETGDVENGINGASQYTHSYLFCGLPLEPLEKDLRNYCDLMREYKQAATLEGNKAYHQFILNLMGRCNDPLIMTGDAMNQDVFLKNNGINAALQVYWLHRLQLAYYFDDMDLAVEMATKFGTSCKNLKGHFIYCLFVFFEGLTYLRLARKSNKRKDKTQAMTCIKIMRKWVKAGVVNCLHKLLLLEAELKSLTAKNAQEVKEDYEFAMKSARRAGFVQDNALACERAGVFFLQHKDDYWASTYLSDAHRLYTEWGAQGKADHFENQYRYLFSPSTTDSRVFSSPNNLKGRQRYSSRLSIMHKRLSVEEIEKRGSSELLWNNNNNTRGSSVDLQTSPLNEKRLVQSSPKNMSSDMPNAPSLTNHDVMNRSKSEQQSSKLLKETS